MVEDDLKLCMQHFEALEDVIHQQTRFRILNVLDRFGVVRYRELKDALGITSANLSNHMRKLEEAGLIAVRKYFDNRTPVTEAALTGDGETRYARHLYRLGEIERLSRPGREGRIAKARGKSG